MKQLVLACLSILHEFFDKLKRQLKRAEKLINFEPDDVGHIVSLTIGHRSKPTEYEVAYITTIFKEAGFKFEKKEFEDPEVTSP